MTVKAFIPWVFGIIIFVLLTVVVMSLRKWAKSRRGQDLPSSDPFTIPRGERLDIAISTLEQMVGEAGDETIREALRQRLEQLRSERERYFKGKGG